MRALRIPSPSFLLRSFGAIAAAFLVSTAWAQDNTATEPVATEPAKTEPAAETAATPPATGAQFKITPGAEGNLIRFESKAPMESFEGTTKTVSGTLTIDPAAIGETLALVIDVDLASFDTGVKMRNQHMCENHFQTDKFPKSTFTGGKVVKGAGTNLTDGKEHEILVEGVLDLHGVKKTIQTPIKLTYKPEPGNVNISTSFMVKLSDYEIPRPQMLFMKLSEDQKVSATLVAAKS